MFELYIGQTCSQAQLFMLLVSGFSSHQAAALSADRARGIICFYLSCGSRGMQDDGEVCV